MALPTPSFLRILSGMKEFHKKAKRTDFAREYAHILHFEDTGEYRLYNYRWQGGKDGAGSCGPWIFRDDLSRPVHLDARGVRLKPGDEIQLGRAIIRFQVK